MSKFKRFDQYVAEAKKEPFELPVDDEKTIYIQQPTGGQMMDAQEMAADGKVRDQLRVLCGEAADEVLPLLTDAPGDVIGALVKDIMAHFGYEAGEASTRT